MRLIYLEDPKDKEDLREAVNSCMEKLRINYPRIQFPDPNILFTLKGRVAGQADYRNWSVNFNLDYMREYREDMLKDTVPHEIAHLGAFKVYGGMIKPHGYEWQRVAWDLGCSGDRCHAYEGIPAKQTRKFIYKCDCWNGIKVGLNIHRKIQSGDRRYCKACGMWLNELSWREE